MFFYLNRFIFKWGGLFTIRKSHSKTPFQKCDVQKHSALDCMSQAQDVLVSLIRCLFRTVTLRNAAKHQAGILSLLIIQSPCQHTNYTWFLKFRKTSRNDDYKKIRQGRCNGASFVFQFIKIREEAIKSANKKLSNL